MKKSPMKIGSLDSFLPLLPNNMYRKKYNTKKIKISPRPIDIIEDIITTNIAFSKKNVFLALKYKKRDNTIIADKIYIGMVLLKKPNSSPKKTDILCPPVSPDNIAMKPNTNSGYNIYIQATSKNNIRNVILLRLVTSSWGLAIFGYRTLRMNRNEKVLKNIRNTAEYICISGLGFIRAGLKIEIDANNAHTAVVVKVAFKL